MKHTSPLPERPKSSKSVYIIPHGITQSIRAMGDDDVIQLSEGITVQVWKGENCPRFVIGQTQHGHRPCLGQIQDDYEGKTYRIIEAQETDSMVVEGSTRTKEVQKKTHSRLLPMLGLFLAADLAGLSYWWLNSNNSSAEQSPREKEKTTELSTRHFSKAANISIPGFSLTRDIAVQKDVSVADILKSIRIPLGDFLSINPSVNANQTIKKGTKIQVPAYFSQYVVSEGKTWNAIVADINSVEPFLSSSYKVSIEVMTTINDTHIAPGDTIIVPTPEQTLSVQKFLDGIYLDEQIHIATGSETVGDILSCYHAQHAIDFVDEFIAFNEGIDGLDISNVLNSQDIMMLTPPKNTRIHVPILNTQTIDPAKFNSELPEYDRLELKEDRPLEHFIKFYGIKIEEFIKNNPQLHSIITDIHWKDLLKVQIPAHTVVNLRNMSHRIEGNEGLISSSSEYQNMTLLQVIQTPEMKSKMDTFHNVLEQMINFECQQVDGKISKDVIKKPDTHGGDQYAGINMKSARDSNNPTQIAHAEEVAKCKNQAELRQLVKAYYILYYFPSVQSPDSAVTTFLLDTSMNRGPRSLQPICKMVINALADQNCPISLGSSMDKDTEGKTFTRQKWDTSWTAENQILWDALCLKNPTQVIHSLKQAREIYENGTYGPRPSIRPGLENRWEGAQDMAINELLPVAYRHIAYHDSIALIEKSVQGEIVPTHDANGKRIIYRVERIKKPTKEQMPIEGKYVNTVGKIREVKKVLLFHGTASGMVSSADNMTRDKGGFNAIYKDSSAAYCVTSAGLVFEFFDPNKGYGAANATHIATSTGVPKDFFNINDASVGVELCLRGYERGQTHPPEALYGVERPSESQQAACRDIVTYLRHKLGIAIVGTSADPVRNHTICYDAQGNVQVGEKFLVPQAHCDDFCEEDRDKMGISSANFMASIFGDQQKLCDLFGIDIVALQQNKKISAK